VLELVGVVESKEKESKLKNGITLDHREQREDILKNEHDRGEELIVLEKVSLAMLTHFPQTIISRIQAGIYPSTATFTEVLIYELSPLRRGRLRDVIGVLFAGVPARMLCGIAEMLLYPSIAELLGRLDIALIKLFKAHNQRKLINNAITLTTELLFIGADILLLPLKYHGWAQTLGLASTSPFLPSWHSFSPISPTSTHKILWTPLAPNRPLNFLTTPASLLLLWTFLTRTADEEYPIANQLTTYKYPTINYHYKPLIDGNSHQDVLSCLFHNLYLARRRVVSWFGYELRGPPRHLKASASHPSTLENNYNPRNEHWSPTPVYRSTALALLPVRFLAERIDALLTRPLTFILENATLRAVARSYLTSSLPKTAFAAALAQTQTLGRSAALPPWKVDASKFGLGLALYCTTEVGIFFALYGIARGVGRGYFGWGQSGNLEEDEKGEESQEPEGEFPHYLFN
jgi:hypothetical protein